MSEAPKPKTSAGKAVKKKTAKLSISTLRDVQAGPTTKQIDESLARGHVLKLEDFKKGVKL
jgi:hypothetical protein